MDPKGLLAEVNMPVGRCYMLGSVNVIDVSLATCRCCHRHPPADCSLSVEMRQGSSSERHA